MNKDIQKALELFLEKYSLEDLEIEWDESSTDYDAYIWAQQVGLQSFRVELPGKIIHLFDLDKDKVIAYLLK